MPSRLLLCLCAFLATCSAAPDPDDTVRALRFRQFISDGALDFSHGGGMWYDCLYLPDDGVVCHVQFDSEWVPRPGPAQDAAQVAANFQHGEFREHATLFAHHGALAEELWSRPKESPEGQKPPQEVRIPRALAREIVAHADRAAEQKRRSEQLADQCLAAKVVGGKDSLGARDF